MANKDNSERIDRYLRNQMTPEESEAFLHDLKEDKDLREEAQMTALLIKGMKEEQAKQEAALTEAILSSGNSHRAKTIKLVKWVGSIAAMFILIFGATTFWNKQSDVDALFNQYYTSYDVSSARGGDDEAIKTELAELYNKVGTEKDISPIIARLQTIYDNIQTNNDEYADYSYYENDIAWYLALAYVKDHELDKARKLIKPLIEQGDTKAEELMQAFENM